MLSSQKLPREGQIISSLAADLESNVTRTTLVKGSQASSNALLSENCQLRAELAIASTKIDTLTRIVGKVSYRVSKLRSVCVASNSHNL